MSKMIKAHDRTFYRAAAITQVEGDQYRHPNGDDLVLRVMAVAEANGGAVDLAYMVITPGVYEKDRGEVDRLHQAAVDSIAAWVFDSKTEGCLDITWDDQGPTLIISSREPVWLQNSDAWDTNSGGTRFIHFTE